MFRPLCLPAQDGTSAYSTDMLMTLLRGTWDSMERNAIQYRDALSLYHALQDRIFKTKTALSLKQLIARGKRATTDIGGADTAPLSRKLRQFKDACLLEHRRLLSFEANARVRIAANIQLLSRDDGKTIPAAAILHADALEAQRMINAMNRSIVRLDAMRSHLALLSKSRASRQDNQPALNRFPGLHNDVLEKIIRIGLHMLLEDLSAIRLRAPVLNNRRTLADLLSPQDDSVQDGDIVDVCKLFLEAFEDIYQYMVARLAVISEICEAGVGIAAGEVPNPSQWLEIRSWMPMAGLG